MELGKNVGKITDYGISVTKQGTAQVFVNILLSSGEATTWYGYPVKKDGEINEMFMKQICHAGFDPSKNTIQDLQFGALSDVLDCNSEIDFYARDEMNPNGDLVRRINAIGPMGPTRAAAEELQAILPKSLDEKLKASAHKYSVRARKSVESPSDAIPF